MFRRVLLFLALTMRAGMVYGQAPVPLKTPSEALHAAVRTGALDEVERLLKSGADVNARDALGSTPLLDAAWSGNAAIAQVLLSHGADPNARHTESGSTALQYSVLIGNSAMVRLLLKAGANQSTRYRDNQSTLHVAAARGNAAVLELLLATHPDLGVLDASGNTPLDAAILHMHADAAALLIADGADVKRTHPADGRGPIHEACMKGLAGLIPSLINAGADPIERDRSGQTPLDLALAYKNGNAVAALLKTGRKLKESQAAAADAMETAALRGQTEIAALLLDAGFDVNQPTAAGSSYLNDAALKGQRKMVQLLLEHGARIDARNADGGTPLHDAALGGSTEVIGLLLDRGAQIDARELQSGATPLMLAASLGRLEAILVLLQRGANTSLRDNNGHSALDRARETENPAAIRALSGGGGAARLIGGQPHIP
jgi:ankyrin repeat protein